MQAEMAAVVSRWNAANLDSTLGRLYSTGETRSSMRNTTGVPPATSLPRFEFRVHVGATQQKSRGTRGNQCLVEFLLWGASDTLASGYVGSVRDKFVNADEVPMTITGGKILEVDEGASSCLQMDDGVWLGMLSVVMRTTRAQAVPA